MIKIAIFITLLGFSTFSRADESEFTKLGCDLTSFSMFNKWIIKSKMSENEYDVMITESRFRAPPKRAVIELNTVQYDSKGEIQDYIFIKKTGSKSMKTQDGFDVDVTLYKESPECKLIWLGDNLKAEPTFVKMSYPSMPEIEKKYLKKRKSIVEKERKKVRDKRTQESLKTEKSELLKIITTKGYEKFKEEECYYIGGDAWEREIVENNSPYKHYIVNTHRNDYVALYNGPNYLKHRGNSKDLDSYTKPFPLLEAGNCVEIINKNKNKKKKALEERKKKSESLYE